MSEKVCPRCRMCGRQTCVNLDCMRNGLPDRSPTPAAPDVEELVRRLRERGAVKFWQEGKGLSADAELIAAADAITAQAAELASERAKVAKLQAVVDELVAAEQSWRTADSGSDIEYGVMRIEAAMVVARQLSEGK